MGLNGGHAEVTRRRISGLFFNILVKKSNICAGVSRGERGRRYGTSANKYWRKCRGGILLIDAVLVAFNPVIPARIQLEFSDFFPLLAPVQPAAREAGARGGVRPCRDLSLR